MKEDCFDYVDQNMVWYINKDEIKTDIKNLIDNAYENFIKLDIIQKNIWNMHMENLKGKLFSRNNNNEKLIMPKFYASSPYFDSSAAKFLNRNHIFS
jgi:hypothetical protein